MSKKNLILIAVLLVAVIVIVAAAAAAILHEEGNYVSKVEQGYRYLEEGDHENAILMFRLALEEDPENVEAYSGLYEAYVRAGQYEYAITVLQMGFSATRDERFQTILTQIQATAPTVGPGTDIAEPTQPDAPVEDQHEEDKTLMAVLNTSMLDLMARANYGDYTQRYGHVAGTVRGNEYQIYLDALDATLVYDLSGDNALLDPSGIPYSDAVPNKIRLDDVTKLFGGVGDISFNTLQSLNGVQFPQVAGNTIVFSYRGCQITIMCREDLMITSSCENYIVPVQQEVVLREMTLSVTVVDATTNAPLSGARVRLYDQGDTAGTPIAEAVSDSSGLVTLVTDRSGYHTITVELDGYISDSFDVEIFEGVEVTEEVVEISPVIFGEGIRFVVTWGAYPTDLDSHLIGTAGDGTYTHIYFSDRSGWDRSGDEVAELDLDDVNGYGPETTTVYDISGSYEFIVDDFTNSGDISNSGCTVKIYVGNELYQTLTIPAGIEDQWHVCTIQNGQITITNRSV